MPSSPPTKPPNVVMFYVEHNRGGVLNDEELRLEFNEKIGKQEKQKWKTKHKKEKKRYRKLLQLYIDANPDFDEAQIIQQSRPRKKSQKRNRNNNNSYDSRARYVGINTYDDMDDIDYNQSQSKRRRKSNESNNTQNSSIDELFREINSGSKRVVRDPEKFKPTDNNKIQMQNLVLSMRDAAQKGTSQFAMLACKVTVTQKNSLLDCHLHVNFVFFHRLGM